MCHVENRFSILGTKVVFQNLYCEHDKLVIMTYTYVEGDNTARFYMPPRELSVARLFYCNLPEHSGYTQSDHPW